VSYDELHFRMIRGYFVHTKWVGILLLCFEGPCIPGMKDDWQIVFRGQLEVRNITRILGSKVNVAKITFERDDLITLALNLPLNSLQMITSHSSRIGDANYLQPRNECGNL